MSKLFFLENAASPKERSQIGEVAGKALAKAKVIAGYFLKGTLAARTADEKEDTTKETMKYLNRHTRSLWCTCRERSPSCLSKNP